MGGKTSRQYNTPHYPAQHAPQFSEHALHISGLITSAYQFSLSLRGCIYKCTRKGQFKLVSLVTPILYPISQKSIQGMYIPWISIQFALESKGLAGSICVFLHSAKELPSQENMATI